MEGLIPMVFKAIRRSRTRSHYECLSEGAAAQTYNIADFYVNNNIGAVAPEKNMRTTGIGNTINGDPRKAHGRRYSSVGEYSFQFEDEFNFKGGGGGGTPKQLVRFRSQRRMFSCLSGAA